MINNGIGIYFDRSVVRSIVKVIWISLLMLIVFVQTSCNGRLRDPVELTEEEFDIFLSVILETEFGDYLDEKVTKWSEDMHIYVLGNPEQYLNRELKKVISELNVLVKPLMLKLVNTVSAANFFVVFGSVENYIKIDPSSIGLIEDSNGLASIAINDHDEIERGAMYVATVSTTVTEQKHAIREELTQSLGLTNDIYDFPESIFYEPWSTVTEFTELDRKFIRLLYSPEINSGDDADTIRSRIMN